VRGVSLCDKHAKWFERYMKWAGVGGSGGGGGGGGGDVGVRDARAWCFNATAGRLDAGSGTALVFLANDPRTNLSGINTS
jgi:hypothetical protein